ncbi:MAG: HEAT repeat domain-containing protein [Candidatus Margulisbacteria bacterium]|nr:HEAT repeat domain-containing protein [Candidatus Margulisiibacteriota bacterium]
MARRVVLSSALLALAPSGCAPLYLRPGVQMETNNHGQEIIIGEGSKAIQFRSTIDLRPHLDKLGKMYDLITELNNLIPSWPVRKVEISENNDGEHKIENNDHLIIVKLQPGYLEVTTHEMGHAIFKVHLGGRSNTAASYTIAFQENLWQRIYYFSLGNENFTLLRDSNYGQRKSVNVCRDGGLNRLLHFENIGHPWDNATELFASSAMIYRWHAEELLKIILDPGTSTEKKRLGIAVWVYLRDKIFNGRYYSASDPFKGISIKDIDITDNELDFVLRFLLKSEESCANAFYYPRTSFYGRPEIYFIRPALEENRNGIIVNLLNDEDPKVREKMIDAISFPFEDPPEFSGDIFEPLLNKMAINDPDEKVRRSARLCLRTNKKWRAKYLIMDLNDPNSDIRQEAISRIDFGKDDDETVKKLMPHLIRLAAGDPNHMVRYHAADALEKLRRALGR